jgi:hypothetical protein
MEHQEVDLYPLLWRLSENKENKENKEEDKAHYELYPSLWRKSKNQSKISGKLEVGTSK